MKTKILVYGVLGYTGNLFLERAGNLFLERALDRSLPIVLGAREAELRGTAQRLGMDYRVFEIGETQDIAACLSIPDRRVHPDRDALRGSRGGML